MDTIENVDGLPQYVIPFKELNEITVKEEESDIIKNLEV